MARPLRINYPGAFYHVACRGNDRRVMFRDDHDRTRFLERLRSAVEIFSVRVHAYVLMSNIGICCCGRASMESFPR
jgi:REP element-mobilizing transposase RayT